MNTPYFIDFLCVTAEAWFTHAIGRQKWQIPRVVKPTTALQVVGGGLQGFTFAMFPYY